MSIATSSGKVLDAEPVSTWAFVERNALKLSTNCLAKKLGGGVIFIAGLAASPYQLQRRADAIRRPYR